jgi:hypothetical protein
MKSAGLEFILQVPNDSSPVSEIDRAMASLAAFRNVMAWQIIQPRVPPQSSEEFGTFHLCIVGHKCPIVNQENRV